MKAHRRRDTMSRKKTRGRRRGRKLRRKAIEGRADNECKKRSRQKEREAK